MHTLYNVSSLRTLMTRHYSGKASTPLVRRCCFSLYYGELVGRQAGWQGFIIFVPSDLIVPKDIDFASRTEYVFYVSCLLVRWSMLPQLSLPSDLGYDHDYREQDLPTRPHCIGSAVHCATGSVSAI